uniref:hypothetical protein n=1 Tax=Pseudarthrobacter cellobiosi TaxID=2953654 RepID=UPI0035ABA2A8
MAVPAGVLAHLAVVQSGFALGGWKVSSIAHRAPAILTSSASETRFGPWQM